MSQQSALRSNGSTASNLIPTSQQPASMKRVSFHDSNANSESMLRNMSSGTSNPPSMSMDIIREDPNVSLILFSIYFYLIYLLVNLFLLQPSLFHINIIVIELRISVRIHDFMFSLQYFSTYILSQVTCIYFVLILSKEVKNIIHKIMYIFYTFLLFEAKYISYTSIFPCIVCTLDNQLSKFNSSKS